MRGAVLVTLLWALSAEAAPRSARVTGWIREAERLYLAGQYQESAALLIKAEAADPDPRLVYNIARAYDQAGDLSAALDYYQRYLGTREGADPLLQKRAALALERIRGILAKEEGLRSSQQVERDRIAQESRENALKAKRAQELNEAREKAAAEALRTSQESGRLQAYVFGGLAIAAAGTGAAFGISALSAKSEFNQAPSVEAKQSLRSTAQTRALIADVSFAVAIASAVTAFILYPKDSAPPATVTAAPVLLPSGAGVAAEVRF